MQRGLAISYDVLNDIVEIDGIKFAASLFRTLGRGELGSVLRLERRENGTVTVRRLKWVEDGIADVTRNPANFTDKEGG